MKRTFTFLSVSILVVAVFAQSPEKISYQAVIRNSSDQLITEQGIGIQVSILKGTTDGTPVYVETHGATTNANGLVTIEIGTGTSSDNFSSIDWGDGTYFIKTETDPTTAGGTNYSITGTSQLLSVPYALHSKTAETLSSGGTTVPLFTNEDIDALNPSPGDIILNTSEKKLQVFDGSSWYAVQSQCWPQPTTANAGEDLVFGDGSYSVTLAANHPDPGHGSGRWSIVEGDGGSFSDDTDPSASFTGVELGIYTLRWTISNACGSSSDEISVRYLTPIEELIAGVGVEGKTWVLTQAESSFVGKMGGGGVTNDVAIYPEMSLIPDGVLTIFGLGEEYSDEFTFYPDGTLSIDVKNGRSLVGIVYGNVVSPNDIVESTDWSSLPLASIPNASISDATWELSYEDRTVDWYDEFVTQDLAQTTFTFPEDDPNKIAELALSDGAYVCFKDLYYPEPYATAMGLSEPVNNAIFILKEVTADMMNIAVGLNQWPDYPHLPSLLLHLTLVPK